MPDFQVGQKVRVRNETVIVDRVHKLTMRELGKPNWKTPIICYQNNMGHYDWAHFSDVEAFDV